MAAYELAHLTYTRVDAILKGGAKTVALVPSGSTEAHGPHLPLATDSIISEGMAKIAAEKLSEAGYEAVVFPCLHYAVTDWAADFAGSTGLEAPTAEAMLLQTLVRANTLGFDAVVLCNAHLEPDNISSLRSVAKKFEEATGGALVFPDVTRRRVALGRTVVRRLRRLSLADLARARRRAVVLLALAPRGSEEQREAEKSKRRSEAALARHRRAL